MIIDIKKFEDKFIEAKQKSKKYDSSILFSITDNIQADFNSLIDKIKVSFKNSFL